MGLFERDPIVRLLEELTQRMASARASLAGGAAGDALTALIAARATLVGPMGSMVERVDGATAVSLLGRDKAAAYAELGRLEAETRRALGQEAEARRAEGRAGEIEAALGRCF